jgi:hypothetical protein
MFILKMLQCTLVMTATPPAWILFAHWLSDNVFWLTTAREPTEGRRRAVHRLSQRRCQLTCGGKRRSRAAVNGCYLKYRAP